jgi:coproporphyrinogen III oxidase
MKIEDKQKKCSNWFKNLRDKICFEFEKIELEFDKKYPGKFNRKNWTRIDKNSPNEDGGYGEISMMKGNVFEKVGVNFSEVHGKFSKEFSKEIPGTENDSSFFACGISLVAHMKSPLVPAVHLNTRFIATEKSWFGGGTDLNPAVENSQDIIDFHATLKKTCDTFDESYYEKFKKNCDEYFFIKHRNVARGAGGIFYDYLNTHNFENDFNFTKKVGLAFLEIYPKIVRRQMCKKFTESQKDVQLKKRGLYTEFNLLYDRGTKFGLMTNGNVDAILMSLPPIAKWD